VGSLVALRSVVVTGASTGIGRTTALRLDAGGWRVFAGVRRPSDAEELSAVGSNQLIPVMLDITDPAQIAAARQSVDANLGGGGLDGLVNNAGVAIPGPLETLPIEDFRRQIEINLIGQIAVTQAMLGPLRRSRGRIVFISSIGGRIAFPLTGAYHASKFAVEAVGDVFRQELRPWGIPVSIIEPGSISTPIWERGEREAERIGERAHPGQEDLYGPAITGYRKTVRRLAARGIGPEVVAEAVEGALCVRRPRARYLVGRDAKLQARLKPFVPTPVFDWLVARMMGL
jgi:NAD(P)-dependent dehydrogenase (short-subunit alcohol dehydrogenase family)